MTKPNGKTTFVTGSTDGVGRVVAKRLAEQGWRVLVHGRDQGRGHALLAEIAAAGGIAEFLPADLSSLVEVRGLASTVAEKTERLHLLINNAGLGSGGPQATRQVNADGCELCFAVNYLAGFVLTHLLLPLVKSSAPARIVNVSSIGQQAIDFDDVMLTPRL
jgi:NAD(P)-dependent dehydrogenase (short-subunit alcohol dehydrogenase family)